MPTVRVRWRRGALRLHLTLRSDQLLEATYCLVAIVLGAVQAWPYRFQPSTIDLVSYLDIGDAYVQGRWQDAINGYWNPLYSWILGVVLAAARPGAQYEYVVAKAVDVVIYLLSIWSFAWFLRGLRSSYRNAVAEPGERLPDWIWIVGGFTLFIWSSLKWITVTSNTPDMAAAALAFAAWGFVLRLELRERWSTCALLGGVLALGYFARTAMFVVSCTLLGAMLVQHGGRARRGALLALAVFLLLVAPFVVSISRARGHLTLGDNWKLNHVWLANPGHYIVPNRHWQGGPDGFGAPAHPSRVLWNEPLAAEFGQPIGGTYPPWTDPSYWYEGLGYRFDGAAEWIPLRNNVQFYAELFGGSFLLVAGVMLASAGRWRITGVALLQNLKYWAPAVAGLGAYLLAGDLLAQWTRTPQPPSRYVGVFAVLFCLMTVFSFRFRRMDLSVLTRRALGLVVASLSMGMIAMVAADLQNGVTPPASTPPWQLARALQNVGLTPGTRVATLGSPDRHEFWARLAKVQIIAEVPNERSFWTTSPAVRELVLQLLARSGASAVVSPATPAAGVDDRWHVVQGTGYALLELNKIGRSVARVE